MSELLYCNLYSNKVLSPDYHLVKWNPNWVTELEIIKTEVPQKNVREHINFNHYKPRDYSYIRAWSPSVANLSQTEVDLACRSSFDSNAIK